MGIDAPDVQIGLVPHPELVDLVGIPATHVLPQRQLPVPHHKAIGPHLEDREAGRPLIAGWLGQLPPEVDPRDDGDVQVVVAVHSFRQDVVFEGQQFGVGFVDFELES